MSKQLDWWRCWGCGKKTPEDQVEWKLTGPRGARNEPYCPACASKVKLTDQHYPGGGCQAMPTLDREAGVIRCGKCGAEYVRTEQGSYHP